MPVSVSKASVAYTKVCVNAYLGTYVRVSFMLLYFMVFLVLLGELQLKSFFKVTSNPSHSMMVQTCLQTTSKYKTKTEGKMDEMASR